MRFPRAKLLTCAAFAALACLSSQASAQGVPPVKIPTVSGAEAAAAVPPRAPTPGAAGAGAQAGAAKPAGGLAPGAPPPSFSGPATPPIMQQKPAEPPAPPQPLAGRFSYSELQQTSLDKAAYRALLVACIQHAKGCAREKLTRSDRDFVTNDLKGQRFTGELLNEVVEARLAANLSWR